MAIIKDQNTYNMIKENALKGNTYMENLLRNLPNMSQEELNDKLTKLQQFSVEDYKESINFLIKDENEAINGYDTIILFISNLGEENISNETKDSILKILTFIKNEEIKHIEYLKNTRDNNINKVLQDIEKEEH